MSSNRTLTYHSFSSEETKSLGERFAKEAFDPRSPLFGARRRAALVFALRGGLGAGKTTFVQGFFNGLGLKGRAPSPTFVIMRRRALRPRGSRKAFSNAFHLDAYRLKGSAALKALGAERVFADPRNIVLVEWADRVRGILPAGSFGLSFAHGKRPNERKITVLTRTK